MRASLLLLPVVVGCTHRQDLADIHELAGERVAVVDASGRAATADVVAVPGGITFVDGRGSAIPTDTIARVEREHRVLGGMEGAAVGVLVGFLGGMLVRDGGDEEECQTHSDCTSYGFEVDLSLKNGLVGAGLVGLVGFAVGAAIGATISYEREGPAIRF